jgi:hypothetical protein
VTARHPARAIESPRPAPRQPARAHRPVTPGRHDDRLPAPRAGARDRRGPLDARPAERRK